MVYGRGARRMKRRPLPFSIVQALIYPSLNETRDKASVTQFGAP